MIGSLLGTVQRGSSHGHTYTILTHTPEEDLCLLGIWTDVRLVPAKRATNRTEVSSQFPADCRARTVHAPVPLNKHNCPPPFSETLIHNYSITAQDPLGIWPTLTPDKLHCSSENRNQVRACCLHKRRTLEDLFKCKVTIWAAPHLSLPAEATADIMACDKNRPEVVLLILYLTVTGRECEYTQTEQVG